MSKRTDFLASQPEGLFKLEGFDGDDGVFLTSPNDAAEFIDDLDDILFEMESPSFEDDEWVNEDFAIIAVLGASEEDVVVQAQLFLLHSESTDAVHVLEMAPSDAMTFDDLPQIASSLQDLLTKITWV